jgi:hypothetical protein
MLSRRSFFTGVAVATAAGTVAAAMPTPVLAHAAQKAEDLTHDLVENFPTYFGSQQFFIDKKFDFAKDGFNISEWRRTCPMIRTGIFDLSVSPSRCLGHPAT